MIIELREDAFVVFDTFWRVSEMIWRLSLVIRQWSVVRGPLLVVSCPLRAQIYRLPLLVSFTQELVKRLQPVLCIKLAETRLLLDCIWTQAKWVKRPRAVVWDLRAAL